MKKENLLSFFLVNEKNKNEKGRKKNIHRKRQFGNLDATKKNNWHLSETSGNV